MYEMDRYFNPVGFFVCLLACFSFFSLFVFYLSNIPFQEFSCQNQGSGLFFLAWTHTVSLWWWPSRTRKKQQNIIWKDSVRYTDAMV